MCDSVSKREYGVDLLRSISMVFIVLLHTLGHGGILASAHGINYCVAQLVNCLAYCGVNCFAIISGYVSYDKTANEHRWGQFFVIWSEAVFYSLLITIASFFTFKTDVSIISLFTSLTPILHNTYWYLTAYFVVFLVSPLILELVRRSNKDNDKILFISGMVLLYLSHAITGYFAATLLVILFFIGTLIKKYNVGTKISTTRAMTLFISGYLFTWIWKIGFNTLGLSEIGKLSVRYDSPLIILMAAMLLVIFSKVQPTGNVLKIIKFVTPSVFSVYLLNDNPLTREYLIQGRFSFLSEKPTIVMIGILIGVALLFFIISICLDMIRRKLFELLRLYSLYIWIEKRYKCISVRSCDIFQKLLYTKRN